MRSSLSIANRSTDQDEILKYICLKNKHQLYLYYVATLICDIKIHIFYF